MHVYASHHEETVDATIDQLRTTPYATALRERGAAEGLAESRLREYLLDFGCGTPQLESAWEELVSLLGHGPADELTDEAIRVYRRIEEVAS